MTVFTIWPDDVQWRRLSGRLFWLKALSLLVGLIVMGTIALLGWAVFDQWQVWAFAGAIGLIMLVRLGFLRRSLRSWGYAERADDLLVRHGLLVRRLSIVF